MSRVIGGLRRLLAAPGLWLGTWIAVAFIAGLVGIRMRFVVAAAVGPFDALDLDRVLFATLDVVRDHPSLSTGLVTSVLASAIVGAISWTLLSPLVIARLAGVPPRPWSEVGSLALTKIPAVVVQSLWHLLMRVALMLAVLLSVQPLPAWVAWFIGGITWLVTAVALDATRVAVVEHDAAPWHIRSTWRGFTRVVRRPGLLIPCALLTLGQLAITATILWLALSGYGHASMWPVRLLALASIGLGLWRVATVIEDSSTE